MRTYTGVRFYVTCPLVEIIYADSTDISCKPLNSIHFWKKEKVREIPADGPRVTCKRLRNPSSIRKLRVFDSRSFDSTFDWRSRCVIEWSPWILTGPGVRSTRDVKEIDFVLLGQACLSVKLLRQDFPPNACGLENVWSDIEMFREVL